MNPILLAAAWLLRVDFDFVTANLDPLNAASTMSARGPANHHVLGALALAAYQGRGF
jgi:hypothetical protein